jgi:hypothetical protein
MEMHTGAEVIMRKSAQALFVLMVTATTVVATAAAVNAEVTEPAGRCVGAAAFAKGVDAPFTVSSADLDPSDVTTIPRGDTVTWSGRLVGVTTQSREISGFVKVDMPWPIPDIVLDDWGGTSSKIENSEVDEYSLPSITPRCVELRVYGEHREGGDVFCSGATKVKIDGSRFGAFTIASIVLFAAAAALAALASRLASPVLGTVAGFLTLLFAGVALLFLGVLSLNSPLLTILPVLGLPLGFAWAKAALLAAKVTATTP